MSLEYRPRPTIYIWQCGFKLYIWRSPNEVGLLLFLDLLTIIVDCNESSVCMCVRVCVQFVVFMFCLLDNFWYFFTIRVGL